MAQRESARPDLNDSGCQLAALKDLICEGQSDLVRIADELEKCIISCSRRSYRLRVWTIACTVLAPALSTAQGLISSNGKKAEPMVLYIGLGTVVVGALTAAITLAQKQFGYDKKAAGARTLRALAVAKINLVRDGWYDSLIDAPEKRIEEAKLLRREQAVCVSKIYEEANQLELAVSMPAEPTMLRLDCSSNPIGTGAERVLPSEHFARA